MNTEVFQITVSGIKIEVVRKTIKNLHIGVYPPHGQVRVAAPSTMSADAIRIAAISRLPWIKRQQLRFKGQARQSTREYVSGESHFFLGRRYRLSVVEQTGAPRITIRGNTRIELSVRPGSDRSNRERLFLSWYRTQLKALLPDMIACWAERLGVPVPKWGVKIMKTKWGSCTVAARRIWLNLELAKKQPQCIEYIVAHEMMHFLERNHTERFTALMDRHLPNWVMLRDELNHAPLGHAGWNRQD